MSYIDVEAARAYMGAESPDDDELIQALIDSAQNWIEEYCNRKFEARTETRQYSVYYAGFKGSGGVYSPDVIYLDDDLLSVTTFTNGDGTVIPSSGYWLEPRNYSPAGIIRLKTNPSACFVFNTDASVTILGSWGFTTGPSAIIQQATKRLTAYLYAQRAAPVYDITAEPGAGVITVPQGMPIDVTRMLNNFRRTVYW